MEQSSSEIRGRSSNLWATDFIDYLNEWIFPTEVVLIEQLITTIMNYPKSIKTIRNTTFENTNSNL